MINTQLYGKDIAELNTGGTPAMDWHPVHGGEEILQVVSFGNHRKALKGHLARKQTIPRHNQFKFRISHCAREGNISFFSINNIVAGMKTVNYL